MTAAGGPRMADAIRATTGRLAAAGLDQARAEAELLWAHVAGVPRGELVAADAPDRVARERVERLVDERVRDRTPLQYLLGTAPSGRLDLEVGPGVFVPRPETELIADHVLRATRGSAPLVVDLCAGAGTLALEIAHARPGARVHAVELHTAALDWLRRNAAARAAAGDTPVVVHAADATSPEVLSELDGRVDVVVTNPPYIPLEAWESVATDVRDHDPALALWSGDDGLDALRVVRDVAARLLRPGGVLLAEHDEKQSVAVQSLFGGPDFEGTLDLRDLNDRPRYVIARRGPLPRPDVAGLTP